MAIWRFFQQHWPALLVSAAGVLLSFGAFWAIRGELGAQHRLEVEWVAQDRNRALKKGVEEGLDALRSIRDLFRASDRVGAREFRQFSLALLARYRGIHALAWVPLVPAAERTVHERWARLDAPDYRIVEPDDGTSPSMRPAAQRERYFPIRYLESEQHPGLVLGWDQGADPVRRTLLERAWLGGQMVVSGRIPLVNDEHPQYGFMAFQPVYRNDAPISSEAERRKALLGFAVGVFRIADLANAAMRVLEPRGVEFLLRDESAPEDEELLDFYVSRLSRHADSSGEYTQFPGWDLENAPRVTEVFPVADRRWSVTSSATHQFRSGEGFGEGHWIVLGSGLIMTLLMVLFILHTQAGIRLRARIEQELRKSEQKLRVLFHQSPDIIMTVDRAGRVLMVNRAMPRATGDGGPGQSDGGFLPERAAERFRDTLNGVFETGEAGELHYSGEHSTWWELRIVPLREGTEVTTAMVIATNVTEKRVLEAHAIRNARLASLGVLAASVAHEINNPNNAIQFNISVLSRSWGDILKVLESHQREFGEFNVGGVPVDKALKGMPRLLDGIAKSTQRIQRIVANLKHMARFDQGELDHRVDLGEVLNTTLSMLQSQIQKHTDSCRLDAPVSLPAVRGNAQQLEQVFINLVLNALQSLPDRSGRVTVTAALEPEGEFIRVRVSDQGGGIPEEVKARVTDPFFTTKGETGGTGLGLSISSRIIQNHSGRMEIASRAGSGTEVSVLLPVATN